MRDDDLPLADLLRTHGVDLDRIIPVFISRFNRAYGDPSAERWDITKEEWQRYEFLGDRVLNLIIAQTLFVQREDVLDEGSMTRILGDVVSNKSLDALVGDARSLPRLIPLSIGQQNCYGERIRGGAFEAFIGCLYCELGIDDVAYFVNSLFADALAHHNPRENAIGILQEYFQKRKEPVPVYIETGRTGPDHKRLFVVRVTLPSGITAEGTGSSLADAKKSAAKKAMERMGLCS